AGGGAGGDVCAGGFDPQGEGNHRGAVRPQLFGVVDQRDEPAAGCESGAICRPPLGGGLSLSDPRRALRASARSRRDRQPGGADRDRHRLGRPPPGAGGRARQPREPVELAGFPAGAEGPRSAWRRICRGRRSCRLRAALREVVAEAAYQRCYVHFLRNALDYVPRKVDDDCLQELRWLYDRRDLAEARRDIAQWLAKWQAKYGRLCAWVEDNIEETLTYYRLPLAHHKHMKSTNMLERLNQEIKRRTHVVRIFPNAASCLRLVRALAVEMHENWLEATRYLNMEHLREHKKEMLRQAA